MKGNVLEFRPCYQQTCDTIDHIDSAFLTLAGEAVVHLLAAVEAQ